MRSFCYIVLLSCLPLTGWTQETDAFVQYSRSLNIPRTEEVLKLILVEDSLPAVLTRYGDALLLRRFFHEFSDKPELLFGNNDRSLIGYEQRGSELFILSRHRRDSLKNFSLLQIELTKDSLQRIQETHFNLAKKREVMNKNPLFFHRSPHGAYLMICQQEAFKPGKKAVVNAYIQGEDTNMHFHLPLNFDGDDAQLLGASIDERGVLYFGAQTGIQLNSPFRKKHLIYSFDPFEKVMVEFDMSSSDFFTQEMLITTADSGVNIVSLYSADPLINEKSNGFSFVSTLPNGRDINTRFGGAFSPSALAVHNEFENETDGYVADLFINDVVRIGRTSYVVMEKRYHDQICTADPSTGIVQCTDQYHFNGISFENPAKPARSVTIKKRQLDYDQPGSYSGEVILPKDGFAWVFYNDHYKNDGTNAERIMNNASRSVMRFVRVDESGKLQSGKMSADRQADFAFTPKAGMAQNDRMAFYLQKDGDQYRIGKFDFSKLSALSQGFN